MSWDVLVLRYNGQAPLTADEIDETQLRDLGPAHDVRDRISSALPGVDWSDPSWGMYERNGFSIEFNIGEGDVVDDVMLHVRGEGDPIPAIMGIAKPQGWSVLDCTTGSFLDPDQPSEAGWKGFQQYRDSALRNSNTA